MRRLVVPFVLAGLAAGWVAAADPAPAPKPAGASSAPGDPKSEEEKTFYALGLFLAQRGQLQNFGCKPSEVAMIQAGLADGALGTAPKVDLQTYLPKVQAIATERFAANKSVTAAAEKKKSKEFLDKIAAKESVKKLPAGELIETITEGKGTGPVAGDNVKVNYRGTTIDGKEFDSSEKHGGPSTFRIDPSNLVKCWCDALEYMKPGGKVKLYCPSDLAYGDDGHGPDIPPGAALVFDLELLEIVK
ncbi:MAG TPA: FKBP-type peptidyl-prolyl cis-trans isomerase [Candidatus Polarisedimenticolaceae bacterium]|nr:FKBP-type peptidyl-prolyl cis-trans isomerase [Candidatus Polarisedimenticolaceae bacterium]